MAGSHYAEWRASADLAPYVACNWMQLVGDDVSTEPTAILPDGCADILVIDDAPPYVVGPDATTRWAPLRRGSSITGIRIRPGAFRSVFGCPATLLLDGGAPLAEVARGGGVLAERLRSATDFASRHALLEDWVRSAAALHGSASDRAVALGCRMLATDPALEIGALASRLDWNARTLHRRFRDACGYGPKHVQRVLRLQRAIRELAGGAVPRLAEVAAAAGYADQAHMTRDFRDLTGFTPKTWGARTR
jgi:AraC-like DNA-binding protein